MKRLGVAGIAALLALTAACSGQPKQDAADPAGNATTMPDDGLVASPAATASGSAAAVVKKPGKVVTVRQGGKKITVVVPPKTSGGVPEANLYSGAAATQGITKSKVTLCAHAGITLASLFGNDADQLEQTYWRMVNEEQGGIYGRTVEFNYEDDGYNPQNTPAAFTACQDRKPMMMIGGIGFDQTPTFRSLAEQNKELYLYGIANEKGTDKLVYSFAAAPSVERFGGYFAGAVLKKAKGKKIGVLTVSSEGWKPGASSFLSSLKKRGYSAAVPVEEIGSNNDVLTSHVVNLKQAGVDVVFLNINALAWTRFVTEADGQDWHPIMVGYGFNLLTDTVGQQMREFPNSFGLSVSPVWDPQTTYQWSSEYERMKRYYATYWNKSDPNDIDWIQWIAMKGIHRMLLLCGKDCNRNKIAGMLLTGYKAQEKPNCPVDFSRDPRHRLGGYYVNLWESFDRADTQYWKQITTCVDGF